MALYTVHSSFVEHLKGKFKKGAKGIINSRQIRSVSKSYLPSKETNETFQMKRKTSQLCI